MTTVADARLYRRLSLYYAVYTGGFVAFVLLMALAERMGLGPRYIGYAFMIATVVLYAVIPTCPNTTWPGGACRRSSTAWPPVPTG